MFSRAEQLDLITIWWFDEKSELEAIYRRLLIKDPPPLELNELKEDEFNDEAALEKNPESVWSIPKKAENSFMINNWLVPT